MVHLSVVTEPAFGDTLWGCSYRKGIAREAVRQGFPLSGGKNSACLLIGCSIPWLLSAGGKCRALEQRAIILGPDVPETGAFSSVSMDYCDAMAKIRSYLASNGRTRTALVGVNSSSLSDRAKEMWFVQAGLGTAVYPNEGNARACCEAVARDRDAFDSVVCCSDFVAVLLLSLLSSLSVRVPEDLWILSFGDTRIGALSRPGLTSFVCDYEKAGRAAVRLAMALDRNPDVGRAVWTIPGTLVPRGTTGGTLPSPRAGGAQKRLEGSAGVFFEDRPMEDLQRAERLFTRLGEHDWEILLGLRRGDRYAAIAEACNMSENTLKYRIARMEKIIGASSRAELLSSVSGFLFLKDSTGN